MKLADRSICPRRGDFNNLYTEFCRLKYGAKNGTEMFSKMTERLVKLSVLSSEECQVESLDDYHILLNMAGIKLCLNV